MQYKRITNFLIPLALVFGVFLSAQSVVAYQSSLPTKTPTPTSEPTTSATISPTPLARAVGESFLQADLSILSGNVQRPNGMFWHNNMVYTSCNGDWTIYEINGETGATTTYIYGIRNAHQLHAETVENELQLWIPDFQTNELVLISQRAIQKIAGDLQGPWGIIAYHDDFLVTNLLANNLVKITRGGEVEIMVNNLRSPTGVAVDGDVVYVANNGSARRAIEWFELAEQDQPIDASSDSNYSLVSGLQNVTGVVLGSDEKLYFSYALGTRGVVGRIDPNVCRDKGGCTHDEVEIVVYTDLASPIAGLTLSPDLRLYLHTIFSPDIYYIDLPS
ncbi:MAG: YncE family protein [Phototrophicaceae bacterium]